MDEFIVNNLQCILEEIAAFNGYSFSETCRRFKSKERECLCKIELMLKIINDNYILT
jgi:AraC-like DNA-binding protein